MKSAFRLLALAAMALILVACKGTQTRDPDGTDTGGSDTTTPTTSGGSDRTGTTPTTSAYPNPGDYTDARNFDNPESPLSKRVIYFDFDQSSVRPEYREIVIAHAAYLAAHGSAKVTLEGHADERGSREYNLGLGERRGNSVDQLMVAAGAGSAQGEVVSYGEERPLCRVPDENCWQENRRVEIVYLSR